MDLNFARKLVRATARPESDSVAKISAAQLSPEQSFAWQEPGGGGLNALLRMGLLVSG